MEQNHHISKVIADDVLGPEWLSRVPLLAARTSRLCRLPGNESPHQGRVMPGRWPRIVIVADREPAPFGPRCERLPIGCDYRSVAIASTPRRPIGDSDARPDAARGHNAISDGSSLTSVNLGSLNLGSTRA